MKKLQIFASLWVIGFPLPVIFPVSQHGSFPEEKVIQTSYINPRVRTIKEPGLALSVLKNGTSGIDNLPAGSNLLTNKNDTQPTIPGRSPADTSNKAIKTPASSAVTRSACSPEKIAKMLIEVREPATSSASTVVIDCDLTLKSTDVVTKRLIFEGDASSGITFNGNGATLNGGKGTINYKKDMIEVRSGSKVNNGVKTWQRPKDITIKNCNIIGSVRIWGMAKNGQGNEEYADNGLKVNYYKSSSRKLGHTTRARNNAPKNIVLDNLTITGVGRNPLYFAPGVSYSKLINSEMKGESDAVAIYLDAESYHNTIKNNYIHTVTGNEIFERWDKPLIAIDGSSFNDIIDNRFSSLNHGGIYLYRNCGEGGVIRHATPSHNRIINNVFYYNVYQGGNPAVYLSSKNADLTVSGGMFGFCGEDAGYDFGSSKSNLDYAQYNVVMQNQIYKRSVGDMIKTKNPLVNSPNFVDYNQTVAVETKRLAGCYVSNGYEKDFILHGESIDIFKNSKGEPVCTGYKKTCNDGDLITSASTSCNITKVNFDCQASGSNSGCRKMVGCPVGQKIIGAKGAANLEHGSVSDNDVLFVPANTLKVVRQSDAVWDGSAFIGNTNLVIGQKPITGIVGLTRVMVGCKEHDENGGDCDIKGILYCRGVNNSVLNPDEGVVKDSDLSTKKGDDVLTGKVVITAGRNASNEEEEKFEESLINPGEDSWGGNEVFTEKTNDELTEKTVITTERNAKNEAREDSRFEVSISPNPSKQNFKVQIKGASTNGRLSIRVFDFNGRLIEVQNSLSSGKTVTLGDKYLPGLYIIETIRGTDRKTMKVIKQ